MPKAKRQGSMEDIGMSPDYRSGVIEEGICSVCEGVRPIAYLFRCRECGDDFCPGCGDVSWPRSTCYECEQKEEG